jgi:hypothetical protein
VAFLMWPVAGHSKSDGFANCVPKEISLKGKISEDPPDSSPKSKKPRTIEQKLIDLKARCSNGKLVDKGGREIRFVHLLGCWGNPPENYQELLDKQQVEISKLKEKYTVIEISCDQGFQPIQ